MISYVQADRPSPLRIVFRVQRYIIEYKLNTLITVTHSTLNVQQRGTSGPIPFSYYFY